MEPKGWRAEVQPEVRDETRVTRVQGVARVTGEPGGALVMMDHVGAERTQSQGGVKGLECNGEVKGSINGLVIASSLINATSMNSCQMKSPGTCSMPRHLQTLLKIKRRCYTLVNMPPYQLF